MSDYSGTRLPCARVAPARAGVGVDGQASAAGASASASGGGRVNPGRGPCRLTAARRRSGVPARLGGARAHGAEAEPRVSGPLVGGGHAHRQRIAWVGADLAAGGATGASATGDPVPEAIPLPYSDRWGVPVAEAHGWRCGHSAWYPGGPAVAGRVRAPGATAPLRERRHPGGQCYRVGGGTGRSAVPGSAVMAMPRAVRRYQQTRLRRGDEQGGTTCHPRRRTAWCPRGMEEECGV